MKTIIVFFFSLILNMAYSQTESQVNNTTVGFEPDALPYIAGGYYGSAWIGHNHFRYRAVISKLETTDFIIEDGFTNNEIQAYAIIVDYFIEADFKGWWIGTGIEYWESTG